MGRKDNGRRLDPVEREAHRVVELMQWRWDDAGAHIKALASSVAIELVTLKEQNEMLRNELEAARLRTPDDGGDPPVLYTMNTGGNVHETCSMLNRLLPELAPHLVQVEYNGGHHSLAVFKAPASLLARLREEKKIW